MKKRTLSFVMAFSLVTGLMPYTAHAEETILAEVRYSTDAGMSWTESGLMDALQSSGTDQTGSVQVELLQDITLTANNWKSSPLAVAGKENSRLVIDGKGHMVKRGNGILSGLFSASAAGSVITFRNITIDGGAVWQTDNLAMRSNSGIKTGPDASLVYVSGGATVVLGNGTTLQNNDTGENGEGAAVMAGNAGSPGTLVMDAGTEIKNNFAKNGTAVYVYNENSFFKMNGGEIYGNTSTASDGGVVYNNGTFEMYGGKIHDNAGGVVSVHNSSVNIPGMPTVIGNTGNGTTDGVYTYVTGVTLNTASLTFTRAGESRQLIASVVPSTAENKNVKWISSNADIATVDDKGNVKAVSNGTCTVTAVTEDNNLMAVCKVTVNLPAEPTTVPTIEPTIAPTVVPTTEPAVEPTIVPTTEPTVVPTTEPTTEPTTVPTTAPTAAPTTVPTMAPEKLAAIELNSELNGSQTGNKIDITWGITDEADGYDVYVQYCGKEFNAKSLYPVNDGDSVNNGGTAKLTVRKINGKAIDKKKSYKSYVVAYKIINGEKVTLGRSIYMHFAGSQSKKYTDVKNVDVSNTSYTLDIGGTAQINASVALKDTSKEELSENHTRQFRYATDNQAVATVSKSGQITATGEGSCTIYVYAKNGCSEKINVTVE